MHYEDDDNNNDKCCNRVGKWMQSCCSKMVTTPDRCITHVKTLFNVFGFRFMIFLIFSLHILKGFIFGKGGEGFVGVPVIFLLRTFKELNSVDIQVLQAVTMAPWALKPLFGILSDTLFIAGYSKLPYISMTVIPATISCILIALLWPITPVMFTLLLFIIHLHMSMVDLFTEAKYSEKIRKNPDKGPALISFIWSGIFAFDILGIVIVGMLVTVMQDKVHYVYLIPASFLFLSIYPTCSNWIGDFHLDFKEGSKLVDLTCNTVGAKLPYYTLSEKEEEEEECNRRERRDCLLCKDHFDDKDDAHFVFIIRKYIHACCTVMNNEKVATSVYTTYFEEDDNGKNDDDDDDDGLFNNDVYKLKGKGLVPMTFKSIKAHLDGLHHNNNKDEDEYDKRDAVTALTNIITLIDDVDDGVDKEDSKHMIFPLIGLHLEKIKEGWRVFTLALLLGVISIVMASVGLARIDPLYLCLLSMVSSCIIICSFYLLVDRRIANIQSFNLLQNMFSVSIGAATFFFFIDTPEQYPEGPHFPTYFVVTVFGLVGSFCGFLGTMSYQWLMSDWPYRKVFIVTNILLVIVSLLNVGFYKRWNVAIGIPDTFFVLGTEAFQVIVAAWVNMPSTIMISQLSPKGYESTMFAILAGSGNLGNIFSQYNGAFILHILGITPNGSVNESHKFDNLWIASIISTILPFIPLVLVKCLVPDARQTENLLELNKDGGGDNDEEIIERI
jgi:folate/biopterin transporter